MKILAMLLGLALARPLALRAQQLPFAIERYDLSLRIDPPTRRVQGEARLALRALDQPVSKVVLSLNELLKVSSVRREGAETAFAPGARVAEGRELAITLAPPLAPKAGCALEIRYEGTGLDPDEKGADWMGILLVREDEIRMSHQSQWYPIAPRDLQARSKLAAPVTLVLDLPASFESLGPGALQPLAKAQDRERHTWICERAVQPSILAGKYRPQLVTRGQSSIRVLAFAEHAAGTKAWGEESGAALEALGSWLGPLENAQYGIAEMHVRNNSKSYNYEAGGFSVYDSVLFDGRAPDAKKIAHEVAHLWFGGAVDASGPGERFLTEGLAEYAAWKTVEQRLGAEAGLKAARAGLERYLRSPGEEAALASADFSSPRYSQVVYAKGAFAMRALESWIGTDAVRAGLRDYIAGAEAKGGAATLEGLLAALRAKGKANVDAWAEEWLRRSGSPSYAVAIDANGKGGKLVQQGELYRTPIELELHDADGKTKLVKLQPKALETAWTASGIGKVESVVIDPKLQLLFARKD